MLLLLLTKEEKKTSITSSITIEARLDQPIFLASGNYHISVGGVYSRLFLQPVIVATRLDSLYSRLYSLFVILYTAPTRVRSDSPSSLPNVGRVGAMFPDDVPQIQRLLRP